MAGERCVMNKKKILGWAGVGLLVLVVVLAASRWFSPSAPAPVAPTPTTPVPATPIPVATAKPGASPGQTDAPRVFEGEYGVGDVVGEIGVPSGLVGADGEPVFTLMVQDISLEPTCPARLDGAVFTADSGQFLIARVEATMAPSFAEQTPDTPFLTVDSDAFTILDATGKSAGAAFTEKAYGCFTLDERIQPFVNPGETVSGMVVLESSVDHGYLQYNPWGVAGSGWVWEF